MKEYPSIPREVQTGLFVHVFGKLDGSNIRAEWSKKQGFYKFGSRRRLLGDSQVISRSKDLIKAQEDAYGKIAKEQRWERVILFFEFFGPRSFAGLHDPNDAHEVLLIDANPHKQGFLPPKDFVRVFESVPTAPLLAHCACTAKLVQEVRESALEGMPEEGVICKAANPKKQGPLMFKIKSQRWLDRLRTHCGEDDELYQRLV